MMLATWTIPAIVTAGLFAWAFREARYGFNDSTNRREDARLRAVLAYMVAAILSLAAWLAWALA